MFCCSFSRDPILLGHVSPDLRHDISSRAKKLTESPVLHCVGTGASALVLDFLSPENEILWDKIRFTHSLVVGIVHDDDVWGGGGGDSGDDDNIIYRTRPSEDDGHWTPTTF